MPGQRKRRRKKQEEWERHAALTDPGTGHWEVLFHTEDHAELRDRVRRLHAERPDLPAGRVRIDIFCGRMVQPTVHQVSVFVPDEPRS